MNERVEEKNKRGMLETKTELVNLEKKIVERSFLQKSSRQTFHPKNGCGKK